MLPQFPSGSGLRSKFFPPFPYFSVPWLLSRGNRGAHDQERGWKTWDRKVNTIRKLLLMAVWILLASSQTRPCAVARGSALTPGQRQQMTAYFHAGPAAKVVTVRGPEHSAGNARMMSAACVLVHRDAGLWRAGAGTHHASQCADVCGSSRRGWSRPRPCGGGGALWHYGTGRVAGCVGSLPACLLCGAARGPRQVAPHGPCGKAWP